MPQHLLIGSIQPYSGKSATIIGVAHQLQKKGIAIAYGKPIGTCPSETAEVVDEDVRFIAQILNLPNSCLRPTLFALNAETVRQRIQAEDLTDYAEQLRQYSLQNQEFALWEGPGSLEEASLFDLSLLQIAQALDAAILLTVLFDPISTVDAVLSAKARLGDRLIGISLNDIPPGQLTFASETIKPFLEAQGISVLGLLPSNQLLRSVSVKELVRQLKAEVLCCHDRLDLMVEQLTIGAMNISSALKYFRKAHNMAVVTGGDRTDIQLAALETSTQCLVLTGHVFPSPMILSRAEDAEIPILAVDLDTLTTVEVIERTFEQVRLQEAVKVQCVRQMIAKHFDTERLMAQLGLKPVVRL